MLGSAISIACANIMLNTIVTKELKEFADTLEGAADFKKELTQLIKKVYGEHKRIVFNGDGYSEEWKEEAERRGLMNLPTTVDALPHYISEKNLKLFSDHKIYTPVEMRSRYEIILEGYVKTINIAPYHLYHGEGFDINGFYIALQDTGCKRLYRQAFIISGIQKNRRDNLQG